LHGLLQSIGWSKCDLLAGLHLDHLADVTLTVGIQATVLDHDRSATAGGSNVGATTITPLAEKSDSTSALR
jgi:hypothetical protein